MLAVLNDSAESLITILMGRLIHSLMVLARGKKIVVRLVIGIVEFGMKVGVCVFGLSERWY